MSNQLLLIVCEYGYKRLALCSEMRDGLPPDTSISGPWVLEISGLLPSLSL